MIRFVSALAIVGALSFAATGASAAVVATMTVTAGIPRKNMSTALSSVSTSMATIGGLLRATNIGGANTRVAAIGARACGSSFKRPPWLR
jgi:hypothetical protein